MTKQQQHKNGHSGFAIISIGISFSIMLLLNFFFLILWSSSYNQQIYPSSFKGHYFILIATDYFSKWVEVVPLKKAEQKDVIQFIKEHLIHRFGIP